MSDTLSGASANASGWSLLDALPQRPPMVLLDACVAHDDRETSCSVRIGPTTHFAEPDGRVPCWVGVEYMAQCAAAHAGFRELVRDRPVRTGFLLGSRRVVFHVAHFAPAQELLVSAAPVWEDGELACFRCAIADRVTQARLAECELNAYSPRDLADVLRKQHA